MRYFVSFYGLNSQSYEVEVIRSSQGNYTIAHHNQSTPADVIVLGQNTYSILIDEQVFDLILQEHDSELQVVVNGQALFARVQDERTHRADSWQSSSKKVREQVVHAPMPGRIVKVCVALDEMVQPGQPLVVMEAMKMENELRAKSQGKIKEIHVEAGTAVEMGARIVTFV